VKKQYVLDTNILLDNPDVIINGFEENDLIIPLTVIEELDNQKSRSGDVGYCARQAIRNIEFIRDSENVLQPMVRNELGGTLRVATITKVEREKYNEQGLALDKNDDIIILTAVKIFENSKIPTIFVSNDASARVKCSMFGMPS